MKKPLRRSFHDTTSLRPQSKTLLPYGFNYRMWTPEMARAMIKRCISEVPSKIA
jgi:hypothetical protein